MIHQFTEIGDFFLQRDGIKEPIARCTRDPSRKARSKKILLLVFSQDGFVGIQVEEYDQKRKTWYLYRPGAANRWDATPTTMMAHWDEERHFEAETGKKLTRLGSSAREALDNGRSLPAWETEALKQMIGHLDAHNTAILKKLKSNHPDSKQGAILSVAWRTASKKLKRVGDFEVFKQSLIRNASEALYRKETIEEDVKGTGQCSVCGNLDTEVGGLLQVPHFKFYTLDKPGSVSGGFDPSLAWLNFPVCTSCFGKVDYAGERVKSELSFNYYGFKYLILPSTVQSKPTIAFECLDRLVSARMGKKSIKRLTDAEDELFEVISGEQNRLQVDLLFYQPDPQFFRPALYVSGLLPSHFRKIFEAKRKVDDHPWLRQPSPKPFIGEFTFKSLREVFPADHAGATFDDDFLAATRAALELHPLPAARLLKVGMRWVRQRFVEGGAWQYPTASLLRSLLFFEVVAEGMTMAQREETSRVAVDYGESDQAQRVRKVFEEAPSKLRSDPASQATFLIGACCRRIENIQAHLRGTETFSGKYKGFRLAQADIQRLFVAAKEKAKAYGGEEEMKVRELLSCAAAALATAPEEWPLSPDEVSYFFALGHALSGRFARREEASIASELGVQEVAA